MTKKKVQKYLKRICLNETISQNNKKRTVKPIIEQQKENHHILKKKVVNFKIL